VPRYYGRRELISALRTWLSVLEHAEKVGPRAQLTAVTLDAMRNVLRETDGYCLNCDRSTRPPPVRE
jgi:hypothetical protein